MEIKQKFINYFYLLILLLQSCLVKAETILTIYERSLTKDAEYLSALEEYAASSEDIIQARALLLPSLNFVFSHTQTDQEIVSADNTVYQAGETNYPTDEYTLEFSQSIYDFSRWAAFDKAKAEKRLISSELQGVRQDLIERVADRYFSALAANENYEAIKSEKKAVAKHYKLAKARGSQLGRASDLLDAEARYFQVQSREVELRNRFKAALQKLSELTGSVPQSLTLIGDSLLLAHPQPSDPEEVVRLALANNPQINSARHAVEVARQQLRQDQGQRYPTLDLSLRANNRETEGTLFGGGSEVETSDIAVSLNVPLYSGGSVSSKIRQSAHLLSSAERQLEMKVRRVRTDSLAAYDGILSSIAKVEALARSVKAHEMSVVARTEENRSGLIPTTALVEAERDLFYVRVEFANARYDYILNTLKLKKMVGSLTEADIAYVDTLLTGGEKQLNSFGF